jgi:hypothetical protein
MYAFYNCSLFYPIVGPLPLGDGNNKDIDLSQKLTKKDSQIEMNNLKINWNVALEFSEPGGAYDIASFGEKTDSSNGQINSDFPKNPPGITPYIRTWFNTRSPDPYDELWKEYKQYSNENNVWDLSVQWVPSDHISQTTITISWNKNSVANSKYNSVVLYDKERNIKVADMLIDTSYTFTCPAFLVQNFDIICSKNTNQPPATPSNPTPNNGATDRDIETDLSWTCYDPNPDDTLTYDIYFGLTSPPPKIITNQSATSYDPGKLDSNNVYYWRIVAWDSQGASTFGLIWHFTTEKSKENNVLKINSRTLTLDSDYNSIISLIRSLKT